jgi:trehalose-phosphatase
MREPLERSIDDALRSAAQATELLVAADFDGTIAPLAPRPGDASAAPEALAALIELAALRQTLVAIISGRALADLRARASWPATFTLVGSHGAETPLDPPAQPTTAGAATVTALASAIEAVAAGLHGVFVERKPRGVAAHWRSVPPGQQPDAIARLEQAAAAFPDLHRRDGAMVLEWSVDRITKGVALRTLRGSGPSRRAIYIGDDRTDEDAFAVLGPLDVGVKVGPGPTLARHRVAEQARVAPLLRRLLSHRRAAFAARDADLLEDPA